jgi:hypothetical protein
VVSGSAIVTWVSIRPHSHPKRRRRHDSTGLELISEGVERCQADISFQQNVRQHEPNDPAMPDASADGKLAEVVVESDQDAIVDIRLIQDREITWI